MKTPTIKDVLCEISDYYGCGCNTEIEEVLKMMEIARIDRIAGALEGIEASLKKLEELTDCIDVSVTGTATTYGG